MNLDEPLKSAYRQCIEFQQEVERKGRTGLRCTGIAAQYVNHGALYTYWTLQRIDDILASSGVTADSERVRHEFLQVLSTLVLMQATTNQPTIHFLSNLITHNNDDASLPWHEAPRGFTDEARFDIFSQLQMQFCPVLIDRHRPMFNRLLDSSAILPIAPLSIDNVPKLRAGSIQKEETTLSAFEINAPHGEHGQLRHVLFKTFLNTSRFFNEFQIYHALRKNDNVVQCYGSFHWFSDANVRQSTIILELAEEGSLRDVYELSDPPTTRYGILNFWEGFLDLVVGLLAIHNRTKQAGYTMVHPDLKPSKVLVFRNANQPQFAFQFKICDFGYNTIEHGTGSELSTGPERCSTKTYGPPESVVVQPASQDVEPHVDIWAVGCIMLEASVWISFGEAGRHRFRDDRINEISSLVHDTRNTDCDDMFHDGRNPLQCVRELHLRIESDGRRCDDLTPRIVQYVLDKCLAEASERPTARQLKFALRAALSGPMDTIEVPDSFSETSTIVDPADRDIYIQLENEMPEKDLAQAHEIPSFAQPNTIRARGSAALLRPTRPPLSRQKHPQTLSNPQGKAAFSRAGKANEFSQYIENYKSQIENKVRHEAQRIEYDNAKALVDGVFFNRIQTKHVSTQTTHGNDSLVMGNTMNSAFGVDDAILASRSRVSFYGNSSAVGSDRPTILKIADNVFNILSSFIPEPQLPLGMSRVRWTCSCGQNLFDDFVELEPGSLDELQQRLQQQDKNPGAGQTDQSPDSKPDSGFWNVFRSIRDSIRQGSKLVVQMGQNKGHELPMYTTTPDQRSMPLTEATKYLLMCIDRGDTWTGLHQGCIRNVTDDRDLFEFLRHQYFRSRTSLSWLTLRSVKKLSLSRFAADANRFASIHSHGEVCHDSTCVCIPPLEKIDQGEYQCEPAPKRRPQYLPVIGSNDLTHYFQCPHHAPKGQKRILKQLPKRTCGPLAAELDETELGWGVHFEEGWHLATIILLIVVPLGLVSLVFGTVWSVTKGDIQGGFAIASTALAVVPILLGVIGLQNRSR